MPKPDATAMCIHQIAKASSENGNKVYVICFEDDSEIHTIHGIELKKVKVPHFFKYKATSTNQAVFERLKSIATKLFHIREYPLRSKTVVARYEKTAQSIIEKTDGPITVIASLNPIEAVAAGMHLKEKYESRINTIFYGADTLSDEKGNSGLLPQNFREKKGLEWEKRLFSVYDLMLIMDFYKEHYLSEIYDTFHDKMKFISIPLLTREEPVRKEFKKKEKLMFVYTGTLSSSSRNPRFICQTLQELSEELQFQCYFLGGGDCQGILEAAERNSQERIKYLGIRTHDEAMQYLYNADVLLSIGNSESPMLPSKIFEYMATGKPIIHVYKYYLDPCIKILEKYGNALILKENEECAREKIMKFLRYKKELDYVDVEKLFISSTPGFTAKIIDDFTDAAI